MRGCHREFAKGASKGGHKEKLTIEKKQSPQGNFPWGWWENDKNSANRE